jgi:hypothetical protein
MYFLLEETLLEGTAREGIHLLTTAPLTQKVDHFMHLARQYPCLNLLAGAGKANNFCSCPFFALALLAFIVLRNAVQFAKLAWVAHNMLGWK